MVFLKNSRGRIILALCLILTVLLLSGFAWGGGQGLSLYLKVTGEVVESDVPGLKLSESIWNFDEVKHGEKFSHAFELTNKSKKNMIIQNVHPSCGCTFAKVSSSIIRPGQTVKVTLTYNSQGQKKGFFNQEAWVVFSSPPEKKLRLGLTGYTK